MKSVRWLVLFLTLLMSVSLSPAWQGTGAAPAKSAPAKSAPAKDAKTAAASGTLIDINHASKDELKTLPGIGDAYAGAIMKNRPYKNKAQLRSRNVIPDATYSKIKDQIIAKQ